MLRWIPCPKDKLCADEVGAPHKVISGYQFTLRIEEPITPQYWYLFLGISVDLTQFEIQKPSHRKISPFKTVFYKGPSDFLNRQLKISFRYAVLVACNLNTACEWTNSIEPFDMGYDIWLLNGHPIIGSSGFLFSDKQFSFDEQVRGIGSGIARCLFGKGIWLRYGLRLFTV